MQLARLTCRAGTARAGNSRAGVYLSGTDRLAGLHEGGVIEDNRWQHETETGATGGWTAQTLPPV